VGTDTNKAQTLSDQLANLPHYHVVTLSDGYNVGYSDGLTEPGALAYVADLLSPTSGDREQGLEVAWIAKVAARPCPLDHGENPERDSDETLEFLERVMQDEPYWSLTG
jgi:hypothetical protein